MTVIKHSYFPLVFFAILIFLKVFFSTLSAQDHSDYLVKCLEAEHVGEYETALEIWFRARQELVIPSLEIETSVLDEGS